METTDTDKTPITNDVLANYNPGDKIPYEIIKSLATVLEHKLNNSILENSILTVKVNELKWDLARAKEQLSLFESARRRRLL